MRPLIRERYFMFAPVVFMLFHQYVLNTAATLHFAAYLAKVDPTGTIYDLSDAATLQQLRIDSDVQAYASLYLALIAIPIYLIYLWYRRVRWQAADLPALHKVSINTFAAGLAIMHGSLGLVTLWMVGLITLAEHQAWLKAQLNAYQALAETIIPADNLRFLVILTLVILVPIAEELLFRGIVQGELARVLPEKWAIGLTLVLFSFFHLNPIQISYVLIPAFSLSLVYALTKNIFVPIVMHIWFNFVGSGMLTALTDDPEAVSGVLFITELLFIGIGLIALLRLFRASARKSKAEAA